MLQQMPHDLLIEIFKLIDDNANLLHCALTCRAFTHHALAVLWHKPTPTGTKRLDRLLQIVSRDELEPTFPYAHFLRRINLSAFAADLEDHHLLQLRQCTRLERITLSGCSALTDVGVCAVLRSSLVSLDLSDVTGVSDATVIKIAEQCPALQGLNLSMSKDGKAFEGVSDTSIMVLARRCTGLRRIKLNHAVRITDEGALALARYCPALLEIDLTRCSITNAALHGIFERCSELREVRMSQCSQLTDAAFTQASALRAGAFDQLRVLDLTALTFLTDDAVRQIVEAAPKIRNLVLSKCFNITDDAVLAICAHLGRYLHYLHLGHCSHLTDRSVIQLARHCTRIRYLDLACCNQLTDRSVMELAVLPKLKRIGLVKCTHITDKAIYALTAQPRMKNTLERVHLSYCEKLTEQAVMQLVNTCHRLTHLSLTNVPAFLRPDIQQYCRPPPKDFVATHRETFCVFSGKGVRDLRNWFKQNPLATPHSA